MTTLSFSQQINASREKIWQALWDDASYREWTSVFTPGSYAESDWKEGSKVLFMSPEGSGMVSFIDKKIDNEHIAFKHTGVVKDGKEQPETEETKKWAGAIEAYTLRDIGNGSTELSVTMDTLEYHADYFYDKFPKALAAVKVIAER